MGEGKRRRKVDRNTVFTCLSVPRAELDRDRKDVIFTTMKERGWGILADKNRYRFLHFDETLATNIASVLDDLDCDKDGWHAYRLSFSTVEETKAIMDSAVWEQ